jgi:phosphoethanolamine N-methyltransferase
MAEDEQHYTDDYIAFLESVWGEGYLSPGGPQEVARVLDGVDLRGRHVLDIGSGSGAITVSLMREHGAARVTGIDVEPDACAAARRRVEDAGLGGEISIEQVQPGQLPFDDGSFDVVFSKDSVIHIPDKRALAGEAYRVLGPGGRLAFSDWLISHDGEPSPEMQHYVELEGLDFAMGSPPRYEAALRDAGFEDIELVNRNPWYRGVARDELGFLDGPKRPELEAAHGGELIQSMVDTWKAMIVVLDTGEHCPHHLRARRPH